LVLEDVVTGNRTITRVAVAERLLAEDSYDMALVAVRRDQLASIMADLTSNRVIPFVLFMLNNPQGSTRLLDILGSDRVLLGFPGAGGTLEGHVVRYAMIAQQPTMVGEPSGKRSTRLRVLAEALRASGFRTRMENDMDAWLSAHALFITAVSGAIYLAEGDCERLSRNQKLLELMVNGVREGFKAQHKIRRPILPFALQVLFTWLPRPFAVKYWQRFFSQPMGDIVIGRHARYAYAEMQILAADCRILLAQSGVPAPSLDRLHSAIDDYAAIKRQQSSPPIV
jgi:2-dehydropantoate 2-reductase